jgi:hypothetical protein
MYPDLFDLRRVVAVVRHVEERGSEAGDVLLFPLN